MKKKTIINIKQSCKKCTISYGVKEIIYSNTRDPQTLALKHQETEIKSFT